MRGNSGPIRNGTAKNILKIATEFNACEICGANDWHVIYDGPIRDGSYGSLRTGATVARCGTCGVDRLVEKHCPDEEFYEGDAYRRRLRQRLTTSAYFPTADKSQEFVFQVLGYGTLRNKVVADVGCAGGSFLDHVAGVAGQMLAIEPSSIYHESLRQRGYSVYSYTSEAGAEFAGAVDLAIAQQVIEHVRNPLQFLQEIRGLLSPGGKLLITTPNRRDILMDLLPDDFPPFFYRTVHRWYFDTASLSECAERAGFQVDGARTVHRYGMSNALLWMRERRPCGDVRLEDIEPQADRMWRGYLEGIDRADCIFMTLSVRK